MGLALFIVGVLTVAMGNMFGAMLYQKGSTGLGIGIMAGVGIVGLVLAFLGLKMGKTAPPPPPPPPPEPKPEPVQAAAPPPPPPPVPMPMPMAAPVDPGYAVKGRGAQEGPNGYLQVIEGPDAGRQYPIAPRTEITIGRSADNLMPLQDPDVSGYHCKMLCANDRIMFEDLGSSNGSFLNEQPVRNGRINSGDQLRLGPSTKIFFSYK